jgi:hypothetical protein
MCQLVSRLAHEIFDALYVCGYVRDLILQYHWDADTCIPGLLDLELIQGAVMDVEEGA